MLTNNITIAEGSLFEYDAGDVESTGPGRVHERNDGISDGQTSDGHFSISCETLANKVTIAEGSSFEYNAGYVKRHAGECGLNNSVSGNHFSAGFDNSDNEVATAFTGETLQTLALSEEGSGATGDWQPRVCGTPWTLYVFGDEAVVASHPVCQHASLPPLFRDFIEKPLIKSCSQCMAHRAQALKQRLLRSIRFEAQKEELVIFFDSEAVHGVWGQTLPEVLRGEADGSSDLSEVPSNFPIRRHLGGKQKGKMRCLDDSFWPGRSAASQPRESALSHTLGAVTESIRTVLCHTEGNCPWVPRSFDLKGACWQCAVHPETRQFSYLVVGVPHTSSSDQVVTSISITKLEAAIHALSCLRDMLVNGMLWMISSKDATVWYIFTEASHEPHESEPFSGMRGALTDRFVYRRRFLSERLLPGLFVGIEVSQWKTMIYERKFLFVPGAMSAWKVFLHQCNMVTYAENDAVRDAFIACQTGSTISPSLLDAILKTRNGGECNSWISCVPTESNIADDPSRLQVDHLPKCGCLRNFVICADIWWSTGGKPGNVEKGGGDRPALHTPLEKKKVSLQARVVTAEFKEARQRQAN